LPRSTKRESCSWPEFDCKLRWFQRFHNYAAELLEVLVALIGDFNVIPIDLDFSQSSCEELFERTAELGIEALAIVDHNWLAGIVRAHQAAKDTGILLIVGCRLDRPWACRCLSTLGGDT
jgi:exonuclease III